MNIIFDYWPRKNPEDRSQGVCNEVVALMEQVNYCLLFRQIPDAQQRLTLEDIGGEFIQDNLAIISFSNYIGTANIAGVEIEVVSEKISRSGMSKMLEEVSESGSNLVFGWKSPLTFKGSRSNQTGHSPVPYHQLQILRRIVLAEKPGYRLQDSLALVERNPMRAFQTDRPVVPTERVKKLDTRSVRSIFSRLNNIARLPSSSNLNDSALAKALSFGVPRAQHYPTKVAAPHGNLSFDTPENRFVKHVIQECLSLVHRFANHKKLHESLLKDCKTIIGILEQAKRSQYLETVSVLRNFQNPSQALLKSEGYRQIFILWQDLSRHVSLPSSKKETAEFLEGKNIALLYEYWVFIKIVESVIQVTGNRPLSSPKVSRSELGESLTLGFKTDIAGGIDVSFNPTFSRASGRAYTTPLRPDVTIEFSGNIYAFDAKYRLERFNIEENDTDDNSSTYKRADLYKMHTYRDAISKLKAAFVVYPGTEFVFFERTGNKCTSPSAIGNFDGVGAVPLRPIDTTPNATLLELITNLICPQHRP